MSFNAGSVVSVLGLDVSPFSQGMLQAEGLMATFPSVVTTFMADPLLGVIQLLSDVATAVIDTMKEAFNAATENADKLNDMSTAVGVNVEQLSALGLVAGQAGSGLETVGDAFKFLGKNAAEAVNGSKETIAAFEDLGISQQDVAASMNDLPALLFKISDAMVNMTGPERTAAAMKLLGRSGTELIPTLAQGSAAIQEQMTQFEKYGATVTASAASSADAWGDTLGEIQIAWKGLQNTFASPLRDALLPMLEEFMGWLRENADEIKTIVRVVADIVVANLRLVRIFLEPVVLMLQGLMSVVGIFTGGTIGGATNAVASEPVGASASSPGSSATSSRINVGPVNVSVDTTQLSSEVSAKVSPEIHRVVNDRMNGWAADAASSRLREAL